MNLKNLIPSLIVLLTILYADNPAPNKYKMFYEPGATHEITMKGSEIQVTYGAFDSLSLVGTKFTLAPTNNPQKAVDFCQDRSAAGAGFQYTGFEFIKQDKMWTSNQAAGNSAGFQWGFHTAVDVLNTDTKAYIKGTDWLPGYYDAYKGNIGNPLKNKSEYIYSIKREVIAKVESITERSKITDLNFVTKCKWRKNKSLHSSQKTDAFYFDRKVIKKHNMQIYMQGRDEDNQKKWKIGPITAYKLWNKEDIKDQNGVKRGVMASVTKALDGCSSIMNRDIEKAVFVLNIGEKKFAIGHNLEEGMGFAIRLERTVYGPDKDNYRNGNFWYQIKYPVRKNPSYTKGEITKQNIHMKIGTADQLRKHGFWIPKNK
jgi:hypothetical protein